MLTKRMVRKFTAQDCQETIYNIVSEQVLTERRIERLKATQTKNPDWAYYDKYADDIVGIDIRIEEQYACRELLEDDLTIITEREITVKKQV